MARFNCGYNGIFYNLPWRKWMLAKLRPLYNKFMVPIGKASLKLGFTPDMWTLFSLFAALLAGIFLMQGRIWWGFVLSLIMFGGDMLDGATARARGHLNRFGTVFDHVIDRYAEFIILGGLLIGSQISSPAAIFCISGMVMASYVRAVAESAGGLQDCAVGITGRLEKLLLIYLALILLAVGWKTIAEYLFWLVGLLSHITALQRLLFARKKIFESSSDAS
jgi:phosphatidylglycerophosphate synthase